MNGARPVASMSAVAIGVLAASAFAAGGLKATSRTETVALEEVKSVSATCKPGARVVSGGFNTEFDPGAPLNPDVLVTASRRAPGRKWVATASNESQPGDLTVYAYCRDQRLRTAAETVDLPAGATDTIRATCPRRTRVISGGYRASPFDFVAPTTPVMRTSELRRAGRGAWKASVFNNGNDAGDVTVYAHCRSGAAPRVRKRSKALTDAGSTEVTAIKPRCKRTERALAGGWASPAPGKGAAVVLTSRKSGGRAWLVRARTGQLGAPVVVTGYVYCERKR